MNNIKNGNVTIETIINVKCKFLKRKYFFYSTIHNKNLTNAVKIFNIIIIFENIIYKFCFHIKREDCLRVIINKQSFKIFKSKLVFKTHDKHGCVKNDLRL